MAPENQDLAPGKINEYMTVPAGVSSVKLLPTEVIHRIAAGEVVDKPSSILKELVENSIDAGASRIRVLVADGGMTQIEVEDDGVGMSKEDLEVAAQRHATSKVSALEDLDNIGTLGFRGEALSAIGSVTRLEIESCRRLQDRGWTLEVVGGVKKPLRPNARTRGTLVRAHDLFFNIPARRKFLRKASSEAADCVEVLESLAIAHPEIAFQWHVVNNGELKAQRELPQAAIVDRFLAVLDKKAEVFQAKKLNPSPGISEIEVLGLRPPVSSAFQKSVRLVVNGRYITDKRLPFSMREAFQGLIEMGAYPYAVVRVQVDASVIDVNIHPQKKEIRWPAGFSLAGLVYSVVRPLFELRPISGQEVVSAQNELGLGSAVPPFANPVLDSSSLEKPRDSQSSNHSNYSTLSANAFDNSFGSFSASKSVVDPTSLLFKQAEETPSFTFSSLRVVGEIGAAWIICESPSGMIVIDQHAAHERINFEKILIEKNLLRSKPLLFPLTLKLPLGLTANDAPLLEILESLGFEMSDTQSNLSQLEIVAVPDTDRKLDWQAILSRIFEDLKNDNAVIGLLEQLRTQLAASLSCHWSVRRGQRLANDEISALLKQMDQVRWGGLCPHGRPVWFLLSHEHIEKMFHR